MLLTLFAHNYCCFLMLAVLKNIIFLKTVVDVKMQETKCTVYTYIRLSRFRDKG